MKRLKFTTTKTLLYNILGVHATAKTWPDLVSELFPGESIKKVSAARHYIKAFLIQQNPTKKTSAPKPAKKTRKHKKVRSGFYWMARDKTDWRPEEIKAPIEDIYKESSNVIEFRNIHKIQG